LSRRAVAALERVVVDERLLHAHAARHSSPALRSS
jgi:hypothetical protein